MNSCADQPAQLIQPFVIFCRESIFSFHATSKSSSVTKLTNVAEQAVMDVKCSQSLYNVMFGVHWNGRYYKYNNFTKEF